MAMVSNRLTAERRHIIKAFPHTYIIFDALDECSEREELLAFLSVMADWKMDKLHVLITSRQLTQSEQVLDALGAQRLAPSVHGEIKINLTEGARGVYAASLFIYPSAYPCQVGAYSLNILPPR
jgi:hypothetical protein